MIDSPVTFIENPPGQPAAVPEKKEWPPIMRRLSLAGVVLVSIFMNFYQLGQNGFANLYYAAAIRSMLDSWHTRGLPVVGTESRNSNQYTPKRPCSPDEKS
ncbi:MAG TPA: hypothetical protein VGT44_08230 [Ktedonobacteraceae bacterium]|nr:hypothetical protein [Ktedonobacteraceae bacterium]